MNSIYIWERKEIPNLVTVNLLFFHCATSSKIRILHFVFFENFFTSLALLVKLLDKAKVTCSSVIQEYNKFMGGVDLSDQIKVTYEVARRSKFRFYLRVSFRFLDIAVTNSKIVYNKIESAPSLSSLDFRYSIAQTMIRKFSSRKRAVPRSRPSKS